MDVRPYTPADREGCLAIFDSNVPEFFGASERGGFEEFLAQSACPYFVMDHEGAIAGCGGYFISSDPAVARLAWGMVRREWQRNGLGRLLLLFRLREIGKAGGVRFVELSTSQRTAPFFQRQGFKPAQVAKDAYGSGFDRIEMVMKLEVCS